MKIPAIAVAAALTALPLASASTVLAQESAKDMKGPPNANGYGHDQGPTTTDQQRDNDGKNLKGPPNANGYDKK